MWLLPGAAREPSLVSNVGISEDFVLNVDSEVSPKTTIIDLFMTTDKLGDKEICKSCFYLQWHYPGRSFSVHKHLSCSPDPPANSPAGFVALIPAQLLWLPPSARHSEQSTLSSCLALGCSHALSNYQTLWFITGLWLNCKPIFIPFKVTLVSFKQ